MNVRNMLNCRYLCYIFNRWIFVQIYYQRKRDTSISTKSDEVQLLQAKIKIKFTRSAHKHWSSLSRHTTFWYVLINLIFLLVLLLLFYMNLNYKDSFGKYFIIFAVYSHELLIKYNAFLCLFDLNIHLHIKQKFISPIQFRCNEMSISNLNTDRWK